MVGAMVISDHTSGSDITQQWRFPWTPRASSPGHRWWRSVQQGGRAPAPEGDRFGLEIGLADANRATILAVTIACGQSLGAPAVGLRLRP